MPVNQKDESGRDLLECSNKLLTYSKKYCNKNHSAYNVVSETIKGRRQCESKSSERLFKSSGLSNED